tara:strand:+ start:359 stop:640 length:282 start_codon:yes stop_codon:yes gene_type:complete
MANRNTYVPTNTRVKARRIQKVIEAILTNPPDSDEVKEEMEADLKFLEHKLRNKEAIDVLGDNHSIEFYNDVPKFKELEDKYLKAPKIALKGL